jgi:hypothetical protein
MTFKIKPALTWLDFLNLPIIIFFSRLVGAQANFPIKNVDESVSLTETPF